MIKKLTFILLATYLTACSDGENKDNKKVEAKDVPPPTVHEKSLRKFTGARTKVVWTQYQNPDKVDKQGTSKHHYLMAIDTANGSGEHKVLKTKANYAYPILTPDGERIVFTRKVKIDKGGKRKFDTSIEIVNFDGTGLKKLGNGYAQEVWEDPKTGKYWIYAGEEFVLAGGTAPICKRIIRFPIDDPSKRETVWDKTEMGTDSFAISRDGKRFAGLFPWPQAGIGNLEEQTWEPLANGCWTSMAPDNSYTSWVFDGPHKNIQLFEADGTASAKIRVNDHPALKGHEVYHPRWGNDVGFMILSGPHVSRSEKNRGAKIEIFIGKFSKEFDRMESWYQVTNNGLPDIYPDIWIEGGESHEHKVIPHPPKPAIANGAKKWPSNPDGLVFKWQNIRAKNEFTGPDGKSHVTRTEADGLSHYGPNYEMKFTSGTFHPILNSGEMVYTAATSFQCLLTADSKDGTVLGVGNLVVEIQDRQLNYLHAGKTFQVSPPLEKGVPTHIVMNFSKEGVATFINGSLATAEPNNTYLISPKDLTLTFGKDLDGSLEHLAFYNRPISSEEVSTDYAIISAELAKRKPIQRTTIKGKLVAMSPLPTIEDIAPYVRALVHYVYKTDDSKFEEIAVAHWAILDSETLPDLPREIGKTYDLQIEPIDAHPQLDSQAVSSEVDELLPLYYDVTPLKPRN